MWKAKIYIETTLKGPTVKDGAYGAILEFIKKDGTPVTKEVYGVEKETTQHRSALLAIIKALACFNKGRCEIEIVLSNVFICNAIAQGRPEQWDRQEWKNTKDQEVAHKNLWQQFLEAAKKHEIKVTHRKTHEYSKIMVVEMRKKLAESQETLGKKGI